MAAGSSNKEIAAALVISGNTVNSHVKNILSKLYLKNRGQYDRALDDYGAAIDLNPEYASAYYNRGNILYLSGKYDSALPDFDQAVQLNGKLGVAYAGRALVFTHLGQHGMAWVDKEMAVVFGINRALLEAEMNSIKSGRQVAGLS